MSADVTPKLWRAEPIAGLCVPVKSIDPRQRFGGGSFRYVDISSIDNDAKSITDARTIDVVEAPSRARQLLMSGDVLVSTVRPGLNAVAIVPDDLDGQICSTGFCVLRPQPDLLDSDYLFGWVRSSQFVGQLVRMERGIGYPAVSDSDVKSVPIPLPPISEQRHIVDILRQVDELRRLRRRANQRASDLLPALFHEMFLIDKEKLAEWGSVPLGTIAPFVTSGPRGWAQYYTDSGGRFIRVQDIGIGEVLQDERAFVNPPDGPDKVRATVRPDDLLITITGTVGRTAVASADIGEAYISQHVCIARLGGSLQAAYVAAFLNHPLGGQLQIAKQNYGQTKPGLNLTQIQALRIPTPPRELIQRFLAAEFQTRQLLKQGDLSGSKLGGLFLSALSEAFAGNLTDKWRSDHIEQLAQEAAARDRRLGAHPKRLPRKRRHPANTRFSRSVGR